MKLKEINHEISRQMALPTALEQHVRVGERDVVGVLCRNGKIQLRLEPVKEDPKKEGEKKAEDPKKEEDSKKVDEPKKQIEAATKKDKA